MRYIWHEHARRRLPSSWLVGVAAATPTGLILAGSHELAVWDADLGTVQKHRLSYDILSITPLPGGRFACTSRAQTTIFGPEFLIERVLTGVDGPDPNAYGRYAASDQYYVYITSGAHLIARSISDWSIAARHDLGPKWLKAPVLVHRRDTNTFVVECPQEGVMVTAQVEAHGFSIRSLRFSGALLGFLNDGSYVCDWAGRITVCAFPEGTTRRDFEIEMLTPIAVPDVFTVVAHRRAASTANAESMFDDVFVDLHGGDAPFALWTGSTDGVRISAVHDDETLRVWQPALAEGDPYRRVGAA